MNVVSRGVSAVGAAALILGLAPNAPAVSLDFETTLPGYYLPTDRGIAVDASGSSFVIGSGHADGTHLDVIISKLDPNGHEIWTRHFVTNGHSWPAEIALDSGGNPVVVGWTDGTDFPLVGGLGTTLTGFRDAFVMKLASADGTILFSTLVGGDYSDEGAALVLNDADEIFIAGNTKSTDFPTVNAYQSSPNAPLYVYKDAFVTKLSPNADQILYSTYFGGYKNDSVIGMALDAAGNIVIAGSTDATDFPLVNPVQTTANDLFVSKLSADGSALLFSTYLGGSDSDRLFDLAMDPAGSVYLVGSTQSVDFPVTAGSFQDTFVGGINACGSPPFEPLHNCDDGWLLKLSTTGGGIAYGTFFGGSFVDESHAVAVDAYGRPHVLSFTSSADFPGISGTSAVVAISTLSADATELVDTVQKATGTSSGYGITLDAGGDAYFTSTVQVPEILYAAKAAAVPAATPTGVEPPAGAVTAFALRQNTPNPFRAGTSIDFQLPAASRIALRIYDARGALQRTVADEVLGAGRHVVAWDGTDDSGQRVASGVYFARLTTADGQRQTRKMTVLR